jgi:nitronate monooxygenase
MTCTAVGACPASCELKFKGIGMNVADLKSRLVLPVVVAPMFLVSGPELLLASSKAGVVGSIPADNARTVEQLALWLEEIQCELTGFAQSTGRDPIPWALNVIVQDESDKRFQDEMALVERYRPPVVITSFGKPGDIAKRVHEYGGLVFHDVATMRHAAKAIEAGVDGLIVLTAGAGGHTGMLNPFAFVPELRQVWDGPLLLAGGIGDGRSILAAEALGADFAYMGTRFAATQESIAHPEYKKLLCSQGSSDVLITDRIAGVNAAFMRGSISRVGLDPDNLPEKKGPRQANLPDGIKPWRDVWSAGHGVGMIDDLPTTLDLVERLTREYRSAQLQVKSTIR